MIKSGAGWCILTNSNSGHHELNSHPGLWADESEGLFAGDYVSRVINPDKAFPDGYDSFELPKGWWKDEDPPSVASSSASSSHDPPLSGTSV